MCMLACICDTIWYIMRQMHNIPEGRLSARRDSPTKVAGMQAREGQSKSQPCHWRASIAHDCRSIGAPLPHICSLPAEPLLF